MTTLYDSHAHFDNHKKVIAGQLERAQAAGVAHLLAVGGSPQLNAAAQLAAALKPEQVKLALGLDRAQAGTHTNTAQAVETLFSEIDHSALSAVGEIGLDYHYHQDQAQRKQQRVLMRHQLEIAAQLQLPVIIHTRDADEDTLALLRQARTLPWFQGGRPGVIHCFTGGMDFAQELLALGYCISFSGIVTFASAAPLRAVARQIPDDRLLIETDSPYLTPVPLRGRPNEPAYLPHVASSLAQQRETSLETIASLTTANAKRLFNYDQVAS